MLRRIDPGLAAALAVGLILSLYQLDWGLPALEHSWAVDGLEPVTVLSIAKNSFSRWNSGWFYFKYPPAYPFTLAVAYAPYLAYLFATGQWSKPAAAYPYGFKDPEAALLVLAVIGRLVSVAFTLGTIAVAYGIGKRLFGTWAGRLAAWLVATSYPVVFYAHTMNADSSYLFWMLAALLAGIAASETSRPLPWALLGVAAAMAVSTKEQAFGFLLPLPFLAIAGHVGQAGVGRAVPGPPDRVSTRQPRRAGDRPPYIGPPYTGLPYIGILAMAVGAIATAVVVNNALFNPLGVVARIAYLMGKPLTPVDAPLKPVSFALFKGGLEWTYLRQFADGVDSALGTPMAWLAVAAAIGVLRRPRAAAWLLLPALGYYYLSLRGQQLITMRYSLPIILVTLVLVAGFVQQAGEAVKGAGRTAVAALSGVLALLSLARGAELDTLLANDSRLQAEAWMRGQLAPGARGEVYQKQTYLPRPPKGLSVTAIPIAERSSAGLEQRRPQFIVLSSESKKSITHMWNPDWRTTGDLLVVMPEAERMVKALKSGELPYRRAAVFRQEPRLLRPRITGLCPEITIYVRRDS